MGSGQSDSGVVRFRRRIEPGSVKAVVLQEGTAALTVPWLGRARVLVSDQIAEHLRAVVAQHAVEYHTVACQAATCDRARAWLPAASRLVQVAPAV